MCTDRSTSGAPSFLTIHAFGSSAFIGSTIVVETARNVSPCGTDSTAESERQPHECLLLSVKIGQPWPLTFVRR